MHTRNRTSLQHVLKYNLYILLVRCTHGTWLLSPWEVTIVLLQHNNKHLVVSRLILFRFISHTLVCMSKQLCHIDWYVVRGSQESSIFINYYHIPCLIPIVLRTVNFVILVLSGLMARLIRRCSTEAEILGSNTSNIATKYLMLHKIKIHIYYKS
mgnify:CR=1 FL=1